MEMVELTAVGGFWRRAVEGATASVMAFNFAVEIV